LELKKDSLTAMLMAKIMVYCLAPGLDLMWDILKVHQMEYCLVLLLD